MSARRIIHGSIIGLALATALTIVFVSAPTVVLAGETPSVIVRSPAPSPDGSAIAFSYMGDIWRIPVSGGRASRLTIHEAYDDSPAWSPDGATIAFSSDRNGADDVFLMDAWGGPTTQLTHHDAWDAVQCWTRDGSGVLFVSRRDTTESEPYEISIDGGMPRRLVADDAYNVCVSQDGVWLTFVTGNSSWWRKHYRGSASRDIWVRAYDGGMSYRLIDAPSDDD
ncbi:hypothetical protein K8S17_01615, partial [bacterium]|nr:hypothetical protein [bacterium]